MTALFSTTSLTGSESYTYLQSVMAMIVIIVWFFLTQACCSLYWCSGFLHHRTWSRHCTVPRDPTLHQLAAGPTPYLHTSRVCSTACEWTQIHVQILLKSMTAVMTTNTDCFVHGSTAELVHAQLGVVFLSEFLILSLDPKLYLKKKKILIQLLFTLMEGTQLLQLSKEKWEREGVTWIQTEIEKAEDRKTQEVSMRETRKWKI